MAQDKYTSSEVKQAREVVLAAAKQAKCNLLAHIDAGDRDWTVLRGKVERYIDLQSAADVLNGGTIISKGT